MSISKGNNTFCSKLISLNFSPFFTYNFFSIACPCVATLFTQLCMNNITVCLCVVYAMSMKIPFKVNIYYST